MVSRVRNRKARDKLVELWAIASAALTPNPFVLHWGKVMTQEVSAYFFDYLKNLDLRRFLSASEKWKWLALCKNPVSQKVDAFYLTCKGTEDNDRWWGRFFTFFTKKPGPFMFKKSERETWLGPGISRGLDS